MICSTAIASSKRVVRWSKAERAGGGGGLEGWVEAAGKENTYVVVSAREHKLSCVVRCHPHLFWVPVLHFSVYVGALAGVGRTGGTPDRRRISFSPVPSGPYSMTTPTRTNTIDTSEQRTHARAGASTQKPNQQVWRKARRSHTACATEYKHK